MRLESWPLLFLVIAVALLVLVRARRLEAFRGALSFPDLRILKDLKAGWRIRALRAADAVRTGVFCLLVFGLSRPQAGESYEDIVTEGIDIMLAIDASGSMRAEDFAPKNRLSVAKDKVMEFIRHRKGDRIGVVVFGHESFTLCPLTLDNHFLLGRISELDIGVVPEDKTAIGMGIASALKRLKNSKAASKIIILLTDGMNNAGQIDPLTAAEMAKVMNVKVYTIGVGKEGIVRIPVDDPVLGRTYARMKTSIDEKTLRAVAGKTGGLYFRASSEAALQEIYSTIDGMEKSRVEVRLFTQYRELFPYFVWPAFILLVLERMLTRSFLLKIP